MGADGACVDQEAPYCGQHSHANQGRGQPTQTRGAARVQPGCQQQGEAECDQAQPKKPGEHPQHLSLHQPQTQGGGQG